MILILLVQTTRNTASHTTLEYAKRLILMNAEIFLLLVSLNEIEHSLNCYVKMFEMEAKIRSRFFFS